MCRALGPCLWTKRSPLRLVLFYIFHFRFYFLCLLLSFSPTFPFCFSFRNIYSNSGTLFKIMNNFFFFYKRSLCFYLQEMTGESPGSCFVFDLQEMTGESPANCAKNTHRLHFYESSSRSTFMDQTFAPWISIILYFPFFIFILFFMFVSFLFSYFPFLFFISQHLPKFGNII
ncbi:hypothetical protein VPH35_094426 [Triticum aestivum]